MKTLLIPIAIFAATAVSLGCDGTPRETKSGKVRAAIASKAEPIDGGGRTLTEYTSALESSDCFSVPDTATESELNLSCGPSDYMLVWEEDDEGNYVPGTAQECCLDGN